MKTWTTALALLAAGTLVAGPAFAQATPPSGDQKDKAKSDSSATKSDSGTMKSSDTKSSDTTKSPDMKSSDTTKSSDSAKPDTMKSAKSGKGGMAKGGDTEQVRAVQQALKDKGHDPGEIDGKMGPKTQAALRDFQSKEGLKGNGRLDAETMTKLGVEAKTGAAGASSSPSASPRTDAKPDAKADSKADSKADT